MDEAAPQTYRFDRFFLDVVERRLIDVDSPVLLTPKAFDTLVFLVQHAGRLIPKEELIQAIWPDAFVEDGNLSRTIYTLRKALGSDSDGRVFIETVPKFGYRFVGRIDRPEPRTPEILVDLTGEKYKLDLTDDKFMLAVRACQQKGEVELAIRSAEEELAHYKASGDRKGIERACRALTLCHFVRGSYLRSIEYAELGLESVTEDDHTSRGKFYANIAGNLWGLRRFDESIKVHEKARFHLSKVPESTALVSVYANMGYLFIQVGRWKQAEAELRKGIEIASRTSNVYTPDVLDSLAELYIRQGKLDEALCVLNNAIASARERDPKLGTARPVLRNFSRCYLKKGMLAKAYETARETIRLCSESNDKRYLLYAKLIFAETCLRQGGIGECDAHLTEIENDGIGADFFVLGEAQRIRGFVFLEIGDLATALKHFSRSRAIFEKDSDIYHVAVLDLIIGTNIGETDVPSARLHLEKAYETFEKLSVEELRLESMSMLHRLQQISAR